MSTKIKFKKGQRVRFTADNLGASEKDELHRVVGERFGKGEEGVLAFAHPNKTMCAGWWFVEVNSKLFDGVKYYVGASPYMFEVIS